MLHRILFAALAAGIVAGLATSALQHFTTTPLILQAELYENGEATGAVHSGLAPSGSDGTPFGGARLILAHAGEDHAEDGAVWAPADGLERTLSTSVVTMGTAFGFALILLSVSAAAVLEDRQIWWIATALATAAGLWLALRVSKPWAIAAGIVLMILPHVVGAPHPEGFISDVPAELSGHFAAASLVVLAVIWALSGTVAAYVWQRGEAKQATPATA